MITNGRTAIWNATLGELEEVETALQVENYWRQADPEDTVYTLTEYAFVDEATMAGVEHDELLADGWTVLQMGTQGAQA